MNQVDYSQIQLSKSALDKPELMKEGEVVTIQINTEDDSFEKIKNDLKNLSEYVMIENDKNKSCKKRKFFYREDTKNFLLATFVLIKKDVDVNEYALRAAGARNSEYIPEGDNEIAYTKMLGGGESDTITFDAPEPGKYVFICSFPGHYQLMMGEFIVI